MQFSTTVFYSSKRFSLLILGSLLLLLIACAPEITPEPTPTPGPTATPEPGSTGIMELGLNGVNGPVECFNSTQCNNNGLARAVGATWDRWPVEWFYVEQPALLDHPADAEDFIWRGSYVERRGIANASFDFIKAAQANNTNNPETQLKTLAILNGIPRKYDCVHFMPGELSEDKTPFELQDYHDIYTECDFYADPNHSRIEGLFLDAVDPNNYWANYVFHTITRLSAEGITHYQTFNEPTIQWITTQDTIWIKEDQNNDGIIEDDEGFLQPKTLLKGSDLDRANNQNDPVGPFIDDYVQMVQVTLAAADRVSNDIKIILGAPESGVKDTLPRDGEWSHYNDYWATLSFETLGQNATTMQGLEAVALHSYLWPFRTMVFRQRLNETVITNVQRPVWITESGTQIGSHVANETLQASYILQHAAYARIAGVEKNFHFRLKDTNEPGFGLYDKSGAERTEAVAALKLASDYLSNATLIDADRPATSERQEFIDFTNLNPHTRLVFESLNGPEGKSQRVTLLWANQNTPSISPIPIDPWPAAADGCTTLLNQRNEIITQEIQDSSGNFVIPYQIALDPTQAQNLGKASAPIIGGPVKILVETVAPCPQEPEGSAGLVVENCRPVGTYLTARDDLAGLESASYACSPAKTYDLSWTEPGVTYAGMVDIIPAAGQTCTITLTNKAGVSIRQDIFNPGNNSTCNGGAPGGDHPDDNESAATPLVPPGEFFALPSGARPTAQVAILNNSFSRDLWEVLLRLGEPAALIELDFDPIRVAEQYPILFIPSGGLQGLENSLLFKKRLELYAAAGAPLWPSPNSTAMNSTSCRGPGSRPPC